MAIDKKADLLKYRSSFSTEAEKERSKTQQIKPMKMTNGILGCALVAGLMTFAAGNIQAGVVIGNTLYSPLKLKLTIGVYNSKDAIKKVSINSKEVLKMLGYSKDVNLAINTGNVQNNDVFLINKDSVLEDLTSLGIMTVDVNELLDSLSDGNNGKFKYASSGIVSIYFYSNPQFFIEGKVPLIANNPDLDQVASEDASDYWFEISGLYSYTETGSAINGGKQKITNNLKSVGNLSGMGYDIDLNNPYPTTVKGPGSANGSGKLSVSTK